jgi:parallel beta-helix repeat protein
MVKAKALLETSLLLAFILFGTSFMLREQVHLGFCSGGSIIVPDDYQKISWAVGNASEGDNIFVKSGVYPESNILVNKSLTIVGENAETTVIDGNGTAPYIFHVIANNVAIENLTLQNTDTSFSAQAPAIRIYNVTNVTINNAITRNVFYAVEILSSSLTKIMHSNFSKSAQSGIYLHDTSCNNTFIGNTIEDNINGIYIAEPTSQYNKFYHNNIINNTNQIVTFGGVNYFDNGYPSGGNYWSDHVGPDLFSGLLQNENGSDGIVDEGYPSGAPIPWDKYPLMYPLIRFGVMAGGENFEVQLSTNSSFNSYNFDNGAKTLTLFLNGTEGTSGSCRVSIPKMLLSCESPSQWNVSLYNGEQITYLAQEDGDNTYLYFAYNHSSTVEIKIKGTKAIPEFPNITLLIILLTIVTLATAIFKAKIIKMKKKLTQN